MAPRPHGGASDSLIGWWDRFGDAVLVSIQQAAEKASPSLDQAVARIDQARATLRSARAEGRPSVNGSGSYSRSSQSFSSGGQTIEQNSDGFQLSGDASWEIDLFGKVRRKNQAARARIEARVDDWHDARISLAAEVADYYVQLRGCEQLADLYRQQAESQDETARLTRISANAGFTAPADAALTDAGRASTRSSYIDQIAQCDLLVKSLVSLSGMEESALRALIEPGHGVMPAAPLLAITSVPADLVRQRPDIAANERELAATSAEIGVAVADLYPSLSLSGSISRGGGIRSWSFGPTLSLPLFDGGAARAGVASAKAAYALQLATYREAIRAAVLEVEQALVRLDAVGVRDAEAERAAKGYQVSFEATDRLRVAGSVSMIDRESARRNALDAARTLVSLRTQRMQYWIALYKALGGGWDATTASASSSTGVHTQ